jgi:hypothetical protein
MESCAPMASALRTGLLIGNKPVDKSARLYEKKD